MRSLVRGLHTYFSQKIFVVIVGCFFCFVFTAQNQIQIKFITPEFAMGTNTYFDSMLRRHGMTVINKRTAAPWCFQAYTSFKQTSESCKISKPNGQKQHEFMKRSKIKLR